MCLAPLGAGDRDASNGESVLFRIGWVARTQKDCEAYARSATQTITVDGRSVAFATLPCTYFATPPLPGGTANAWYTDDRYLSAPLARGPHVAGATITFTATISDSLYPYPYSAGTSQTYRMTLTVG